MRKLTLDEKITIKGAVQRYNVALVDIDMEVAQDLYFRCTGKSLTYLFRGRNQNDVVNNKKYHENIRTHTIRHRLTESVAKWLEEFYTQKSAQKGVFFTSSRHTIYRELREGTYTGHLPSLKEVCNLLRNNV